MRILSGIQPTGRFHWGNYFGAIRQYIDFQHEHDGLYFIADLHALNTIRDASELRQNVQNAALDLLALGLDPTKATLFVQSEIAEVTRLCWLLMTGTPLGLLERCHAFKDKKAKGLPASAGLFTYPVLMAADILLYDSNWIPVGEDQVQHIEVCRDLARSFNAHYGDTFVIPEAKIVEDAAKVPGIDGEKMSKSYDNTLAIFEPTKDLRKKIMRISTDSRPMEDAKNPEGDHLYELLRLVATTEETQEVATIYLRGGFGYGDIKKRLADASERYFDSARKRRIELEENPSYVRSVLDEGAAKARAKAAEVLARVESACGVT